VNQGDTKGDDLKLMRRCIALADSARGDREYPFAAVVGRRGEFVCEASNMVRRQRDVTRHAEMVAMSAAQQTLRSISLDDCTLYSTVEPCAMCSYAIRESGIGRVIFGLQSPVMGGHSRWNILKDETLCSVMPEAFAAPPYVLGGYLSGDVRELFRRHHPFAWRVIEGRRIFVAQAKGAKTSIAHPQPGGATKARLARWASRRILDRLWRA
jgi:tRNA(adenine34) deaminase